MRFSVDKRGVVVEDVDPAQQDALRDLGFAFQPDGRAYLQSEGSAGPCDTPVPPELAEVVAANWNLLGPAMVEQKLRGEAIPWERALDEVLAIAEASGLFMVAVGTAALAARGIEVEPGDIDLVTDEAGAFGLQSKLIDCVLWPTADTGWPVAQWFGRCFLHARVEWAGNLRRVTRAELERDEVIDWRGHKVRIRPSIETALAIERSRGRAGHVAAIERYLAAR